MVLIIGNEDDGRWQPWTEEVAGGKSEDVAGCGLKNCSTFLREALFAIKMSGIIDPAHPPEFNNLLLGLQACCFTATKKKKEKKRG